MIRSLPKRTDQTGLSIPLPRAAGSPIWTACVGAKAVIALGLLLQGPAVSAPAPRREPAPLPSSRTGLVMFDISPFPYRGDVPEKGNRFLDVMEGERLGHYSERARKTYWEDQAYSDRRVLLHIPKGFDPRRPSLMIVFLHGNEATLARDVRDRQRVPQQVSESGLNAALVAPQLAVNALDSSAGRFWEPGLFSQFVSEAGERLTDLFGDPRARAAFHGAPVVIAAYSGGYNPAAFIVEHGRVEDRLRGLILLDAPYGELDRFAIWLDRRPPAFFVSAYGKAAREQNSALKRMLVERGIRFRDELPPALTRSSVTFVTAPDEVRHVDFVTEAWVKDPLKALLRRIVGFSRVPTNPSRTAPGGRH